MQPESPATAMDQGSGTASNSPMLAVHPLDDQIVALGYRVDAPSFGCGLAMSGDAGTTWSPAEPVPNLPQGVERCYAPEVGYDGEGTLYYLFVGLAGRGNEPVGAYLTTSADGGASFSGPSRVLGPNNFGVRMAIDREHEAKGRMHLLWLHARSDPPLGGFGAPPNPILAAYSDNGGATFSSPVTVAGGEGQRVVAPALALGPDQAVHAAWYDLGDDIVDYQGLEGPPWAGTWSLHVASSGDGGQGFGSGRLVEPGIVPSQRVMLIFTMPPASLTADEKRLCVAWTDARWGDDDALALCSPNRGATWGSAIRLNDDPVGNGRSQYLPRLSSAAGRVDAVFYDRRADPANIDAVVSYTSSVDGHIFGPNATVTSAASSSRVGQSYGVVSAEGLVEFGARLDLASGRRGALAAWTDTRNSNVASTGQDVFTARIIELQRGGRRVLDWLAGGAVVAAGLVIGMRGISRFLPARGAGRTSLLALLSVAASILAGCTADRLAHVSRPPRPPVVDVRMSEYRFDYVAPATAGRVVFDVRNAGTTEHQLVVVPLPPELAPIDQQLHGSERRVIAPFASIPAQAPGRRTSFAVDLQPGTRYAFICRVLDENEEILALRGMSSEFRTP